MKQIKYTGHSGEILEYIDQIKTFIPFKRNVWKEVPTFIADILLKKSNWIEREDSIVDMSKMTSPIRLAIFRNGALGDLIQLIPIARYMKRAYHHSLTLITQDCYLEIMRQFDKAFDVVCTQLTFNKSTIDKMVILDGVLELDHSLTNKERNIHRVNIYEEFFNIKCDYYDFSMRTSRKDLNYIKGMLNAPTE